MLGESINGAIIEDVPQRWRLNRAGIVSEDMLEAVPDSIPRLGLLRWHEAVRSPFGAPYGIPQNCLSTRGARSIIVATAHGTRKIGCGDSRSRRR